jgi:hypothetical protein
MYCRLPYVSEGTLPLRTLVLYIYRSRGTSNTINHYIQSILPTWHQIMFRSSKPSAAFVRTTPGRQISTPLGTAPLVRRPILLIQPLLRRVKPPADRSSVMPPVCHPRLIAAGTSLPHSSTPTIDGAPVVTASWSDASSASSDRPCVRSTLTRVSRRHRANSTADTRLGRHRPDHTTATSIRLSPYQSGHSHVDQPPSDSQPAASTTMMSLFFSTCGINGCGHVLGSLPEAFNLLLLPLVLPDH